MKRLALATALILSPSLISPATSLANHHACPVVAYQPSTSGDGSFVLAPVRYRPDVKRRRVAVSYGFWQKDGSPGVVTKTFRLKKGHVHKKSKRTKLKRTGPRGIARTRLDEIRMPMVRSTRDKNDSPGAVNVYRRDCTPFLVPSPVGGKNSPLPAGASFPVPYIPFVPGFKSPEPPDLGKNLELFAVDPLANGPDFSGLRPDLGTPPGGGSPPPKSPEPVIKLPDIQVPLPPLAPQAPAPAPAPAPSVPTPTVPPVVKPPAAIPTPAPLPVPVPAPPSVPLPTPQLPELPTSIIP